MKLADSFTYVSASAEDTGYGHAPVRFCFGRTRPATLPKTGKIIAFPPGLGEDLVDIGISRKKIWWIPAFRRKKFGGS